MSIAIIALALAGCSAEAHRYIRFPNLANPGPAAAQRAEAIYHDPYPLNDIGPEVVGGRPPGFQQPLVEVERDRLVPVQPVLIQQAPMPGTTVVAPPVVSSPFAVAPPQPAVPLMPTAPPAVSTASPIAGPPIVTVPPPGAPAVSLPAPPMYSAPPAPVVSPAYPVSAPATSSRPVQPRAPY